MNKMIKMYGTNSAFISIIERDCTRVTESSIFYLNRIGKEVRSAIESNYETWHKSREEAIKHLKDVCNKNIKGYELKIQREKDKLAQIDLL